MKAKQLTFVAVRLGPVLAGPALCVSVLRGVPLLFVVCGGVRGKDSEAVLGVWLPAPLPTPRALPDHGAIWQLAVGVEKDLGGIDV